MRTLRPLASLFLALAVAAPALPAHAEDGSVSRRIGLWEPETEQETGYVSFWWSPSTGSFGTFAHDDADRASAIAKGLCGERDCRELETVSEAGYYGIGTFKDDQGDYHVIWGQGYDTLREVADAIETLRREEGWWIRKPVRTGYLPG